MTSMAASFIMVPRRDPFCKNLVILPKKKSAGMVASPNVAITIAPHKGSAVLAAKIAKE